MRCRNKSTWIHVALNSEAVMENTKLTNKQTNVRRATNKWRKVFISFVFSLFLPLDFKLFFYFLPTKQNMKREIDLQKFSENSKSAAVSFFATSACQRRPESFARNLASSLRRAFLGELFEWVCNVVGLIW